MAFDVQLISTSLAGHPAAIQNWSKDTKWVSLQCAVSRRSVGSHCAPGEVTSPLGTNDWGVIQPGESTHPSDNGTDLNSCTHTIVGMLLIPRPKIRAMATNLFPVIAPYTGAKSHTFEVECHLRKETMR